MNGHTREEFLQMKTYLQNGRKVSHNALLIPKG